MAFQQVPAKPSNSSLTEPPSPNIYATCTALLAHAHTYALPTRARCLRYFSKMGMMPGGTQAGMPVLLFVIHDFAFDVYDFI